MRGFQVVTSYTDKGINIPERKTKLSAGYDIESAEDVLIPAGELKVVPTGLKAYMMEDEYLGLHVRSSLTGKRGLMMANSQGIIDADYYNNEDNEGHMMFMLYNFSSKPVFIEKGERIGQGIFYKFLKTDDDKADGIRKSGLGSTGK